MLMMGPVLGSVAIAAFCCSVMVVGVGRACDSKNGISRDESVQVARAESCGEVKGNYYPIRPDGIIYSLGHGTISVGKFIAGFLARASSFL